MNGKHEPPSRATFYLSLATGALRAALVAAALVVGVFVLSRAFPQTEAPTPQATGAPTTPPTDTETTTPPEETSPPPEQPSPDVEGVRLAVVNGTSETGLAASTAQTLKELGYRVDDEDVGNALSTYEVTILFYRDDSRREAKHLRDTVFKGANLEPAPASLNPDVRITVALGDDWAAKND
ncbi:MAG TPA: LytR C-terminal domain-containing protein [Actinomycetota bacterium]|nr:LytR C-terminal domain-containing protein [Actinomycetota bacterium]